MYALMSYKIALVTERLITHFTHIRALTAMYALMYYQIALVTEWLITHFTCIRELTTVCEFMSYQTAVMMECLFTHFTRIRTLIPTYITGISAFITLNLKMFIHSTLAETKSLNFRIYSDSITIIFIEMYTLNKNPLYLKNRVIYRSVLDGKQFCVSSLLQIKHQILHLCHTYFRVLYEMHSGTSLWTNKES